RRNRGNFRVLTRVRPCMTMPNRATSVKLATSAPGETRPAPLEKLREFLEKEGMKSKTGPRSFADFERELHERMMGAERDIVALEMAKLDVDAPAIRIDGKVHRPRRRLRAGKASYRIGRA